MAQKISAINNNFYFNALAPLIFAVTKFRTWHAQKLLEVLNFAFKVNFRFYPFQPSVAYGSAVQIKGPVSM